MSLRILSIAQDWIRAIVSPGDSVVDATLGNGHDALFLSKRVGSSGVVYGFDIQQQSLKSTKTKLDADQLDEGKVKLILSCHSTLSDHVTEPVQAIMFNLGYLPRSDKSVITKAETTLLALEASIELLKKGGRLTIVCYPGHEGGNAESQAVSEWAQNLVQNEYSVLYVTSHNSVEAAPSLYGIEKLIETHHS